MSSGADGSKIIAGPSLVEGSEGSAVSTDVPAKPDKPSRIAALDGLRGFALLGMMAWHAHVGWVKGGFARMTVFFVLAGFLAAESLARLGGSSPARFWARRARRLLPVSALGVLVAAVVAKYCSSALTANDARWDAVASLTSWFNWRLIAAGRSYGAFFESPSPFQHFWSLSLEEQSFFLAPVLFALALSIPRSPRRRAAVLAVIGLFICLLPAGWRQSADAVYYGTHVRIGEFIVGMALSMWLRGAPTPAVGESGQPTVGRFWRIAAPLGLVTLVVVMLTVPRDLDWLYRGGLTLMVPPSVAVVGGAVRGERFVSAVLGVRPLVWLGRATFSIYGLHWPLFLAIQFYFADALGSALIPFEFALAISVGALVYVTYERPLMKGIPLLGIAPMFWAAAAAILALAVAFSIPIRDVTDFDAAVARSTANAQAERPVPGAQGTPRVMVFGGSSGLIIGLGAYDWAEKDGRVVPVPGVTEIGCGLITSGTYDPAPPGVTADMAYAIPAPACQDWQNRWTKAAQAERAATDSPIIAVVVASAWDLSSRGYPEYSEVQAPGTPRHAGELRNAVVAAMTLLEKQGIDDVVFTTFPSPSPNWSISEQGDYIRRAEAYHLVLVEGISEYRRINANRAADLPTAAILDLGTWTDSLDRSELPRLFPDGIHTTEATAAELWTTFYGPELARLGLIEPEG